MFSLQYNQRVPQPYQMTQQNAQYPISSPQQAHFQGGYQSNKLQHAGGKKITSELLAITAYILISVAYRYRKSISIIELFVSIISIYIEFLATNF